MILIADSGSTKTDWRVIDSHGQVSQAKTVGFNPYYQDTASIAETLRGELLPQLSTGIEQVYFYGTGVANTDKAATVTDALRSVFPEAHLVQAHSDMLGAARALCGTEAGIACILGTGSNTCFAEGGQIAFKIPSLGFWLGDEGSGGHLGKTLLLSYLHHELPADLVGRFEKRFPQAILENILESAYRKPFPNRYFATYSKFLFDYRSHPFVYQLIYNAFGLFFEKYIQKYPNFQQHKVHFTGSVAFYYSDILRQVAQDRGVAVKHVLETPIAGLTLYHQEK
jgi:N-acetylglucosamine kinase-like BadF-type ATPase